MALLLRQNFARALLAADITDVATQLTVSANNLPTAAGDFILTIWDHLTYPDPADDVNLEIVSASYSGTPNVYDIVRAQEGTSAVAHSSDVRVALHFTAGMSLNDLINVDHGSILGLGDDDHSLYHTDGRAAAWLGSNHETTYAHSNIALNTIHRSSDGSNHTFIDQDVTTTASNFTVAGATVSGLTASRLMRSDGSKVLSSVSSLTAWIAGTTDHISVTDDSDGSVTLDLDANTQTLLGSFNGIFLEKLDFTISEAGGTVTGSLEQDSGGDLIQRFSDGYTTLDCTPARTINLTAYVGTNAVPKIAFVYILQSAKTIMAASNSDWPATEHIKIARLVLKSAVTTGTDGGALGNQNINDYVFDSNDEGHIQHVEHRIRQEPAVYDSGITLTLKNSGGTELTTGNSSTAVEIVTTAGKVYQLHRHMFSAFDMYTTGTDDAHIVNQPTDEGGAYETTADLVTDVTHYVDGTSAGVVIGNNKYFNLVIWGIQNRGGEPSHIMINLPTGQYTTSGNAVSDVNGTSVFEIPSAFKGTGFLIARLTFRLIGGAQWTYIAQEDLRGKFPDVIAGVGVTTTDHALLANLTAPADDHTQYLLADGTRALAGAWDMGSQILTNVNIDSGDINVAVTNTEWDAAFSHVSADGSSHSIVGSNTTAIGLNTTHRGSDGSDHSFLDQAVTVASTPTLAGLLVADGGTIGQTAGPLLVFNDTDNRLGITGCNVGIGTITPITALHLVGQSGNPIIKLEDIGGGSGAAGIHFYHNSTSPADGDDCGSFQFLANNNLGNETRFSFLRARSTDVTDGNESGAYNFVVRMNNTERTFLTLNGYNGTVDEGEIVFNENNRNVDFRVRSASLSPAFFVDGSTGFVCVGSSTTVGDFNVNATSPTQYIDATTNTNISAVYLRDSNGNNNQGVFLLHGSSKTGTLFGVNRAGFTTVYATGSSSSGLMLGTLTNVPTIFGQTNIERMRLTAIGLGINDINPGERLDVGGNINVTGVYKVDDTQVVSNQAAAILDATDAASVITQLNDLLAKLRIHGIIAI